MKRTIFLCVFLFILLPGLSFAQDYPTKPINVSVGSAPGGTMDIATRILAKGAEKFLGQPIVVSNNGASGGTVNIGIVVKQSPDGYHLGSFTASGLILTPHFRTVPYNLEGIAPIMHFGMPQSGLVVKADSPWRTVKEFVEYAKKNPGKVSYSTSGVGTFGHIAMEYLAKQEGIQWTHIPFSGSPPALTALLGGHVTAESGATEWIPHVKEGTLRLLATHGEKRIKNFPNVPIFRELGYDFVNRNAYLMAAPKGTAPSIIKKLDEAFRKAMDEPEFLQTLPKMDTEIAYRNPSDLKKYLEEGYVIFGRLVSELRIPKEDEKK